MNMDNEFSGMREELLYLEGSGKLVSKWMVVARF
jgi:hypothetical protein